MNKYEQSKKRNNHCYFPSLSFTLNENKLKKKFLTVFCLLFLLVPAFAEEPTAITTTAASQPQTANTADKTDKISTEKTQSKIVYKEPVSKRKIAMKFIYAMAGVAVSSILLFIMLTIYNRIRFKVVQSPSTDYTNTLTTPSNLKDAVNIYLEKTK